MIPREQRTLFLGDLSIHCKEKNIETVFRPYGILESIKIKFGFANLHHSAYGFVTFVELEAAQRALTDLQGVVVMGRPLRIAWAQRNVGKKVAPKPMVEVLNTAQIQVSYISRQIEALVSEASLRSLFIQYGEVVDVVIKKSQFDKILRVQHGYGFVHFPLTEEGISAALKAVHFVHQLTLDFVTYDCTFSTSLKAIVENSPFHRNEWQNYHQMSSSIAAGHVSSTSPTSTVNYPLPEVAQPMIPAKAFTSPSVPASQPTFLHNEYEAFSTYYRPSQDIPIQSSSLLAPPVPYIRGMSMINHPSKSQSPASMTNVLNNNRTIFEY